MTNEEILNYIKKKRPELKIKVLQNKRKTLKDKIEKL